MKPVAALVLAPFAWVYRALWRAGRFAGALYREHRPRRPQGPVGRAMAHARTGLSPIDRPLQQPAWAQASHARWEAETTGLARCEWCEWEGRREDAVMPHTGQRDMCPECGEAV